MTDWTVRVMKQAEADIRAIIQYMKEELHEPELASAQTKRIVEAIRKLEHMPMRHMLYRGSPWRDIGLRVMPVGNYLVFYLPRNDVEKPTVAILRVMYGKRNIDEQLSQMDLDNNL